MAELVPLVHDVGPTDSSFPPRCDVTDLVLITSMTFAAHFTICDNISDAYIIGPYIVLQHRIGLYLLSFFFCNHGCSIQISDTDRSCG